MDSIGHALFVDDDDTIVVFIRAVLQKEGFEVTVVNNALAALEQLEQQHFDLIISDIGMPLMDGWEFLKTIKSRSLAENVPFIFLTGGNNPNDYKRAHEEGADLILPKDMGAQLLVSAVISALKNHKTAN